MDHYLLYRSQLIPMIQISKFYLYSIHAALREREIKKEWTLNERDGYYCNLNNVKQLFIPMHGKYVIYTI